MNKQEAYNYLMKWINTAVQKGGFTAFDARNALNCLEALEPEDES